MSVTRRDARLREHGDIIREGWLQKNTPEKAPSFHFWSRRFCRLTTSILYYTHNKTDKKPSWRLSLSGAQIERSKKRDYCFELTKGTESKLFAASSEAEATEWITAIQTVINSKTETCLDEGHASHSGPLGFINDDPGNLADSFGIHDSQSFGTTEPASESPLSTQRPDSSIQPPLSPIRSPSITSSPRSAEDTQPDRRVKFDPISLSSVDRGDHEKLPVAKATPMGKTLQSQLGGGGVALAGSDLSSSMADGSDIDEIVTDTAGQNNACPVCDLVWAGKNQIAWLPATLLVTGLAVLAALRNITVWGLTQAILWLPFQCVWALVFVFPLILVLPRLFGALLSAILYYRVVTGFEINFKSIQIIPWIDRSMIHVSFHVEGFGFMNPPGYPHKYFIEAKTVDLMLAMTFREVINLVRLSKLSWSPFPSVCMRQTNGGKLKEYLGVIQIDRAEIDGVQLNFEMYNNRFNINEFSRLLAVGEMAKSLGKQPPPNTLDVHIISADELRSKSAQVRTIVELRRQREKTQTVRSTSPLWDEQFTLVCDDPSAVLHIKVVDERSGRSVKLLGRWVLTLKWLYRNPRFCRFIDLETAEPGHIKGRFPLIDRRFHREGHCGWIHMDIRWHHDPQAPVYQAPRLTAMQQLQMNSAESTLRLGSLAELKVMLSTFPLLLSVKRVTIREVEFFLKDLFMGYHGQGDSASVEEMKRINVDRLEVAKQLQPERGMDGVTIWGFCWAFWVHGVAPQISGKLHRLLFSAGSQIISGSMVGIGEKFIADIKDMSLGKTARAMRGRFPRVKMKSGNASKAVLSSDEDYFAELVQASEMEITTRGPAKLPLPITRRWMCCAVELRGSTLFYWQLNPTTKDRIGSPQKLDLECVLNIKLREDSPRVNEIVLEMPPAYDGVHYLRVLPEQSLSVFEWYDLLHEHITRVGAGTDGIISEFTDIEDQSVGDSAENMFEKLFDEGSSLFRDGRYSLAKAKYAEAMQFTREFEHLHELQEGIQDCCFEEMFEAGERDMIAHSFSTACQYFKKAVHCNSTHPDRIKLARDLYHDCKSAMNSEKNSSRREVGFGDPVAKLFKRASQPSLTQQSGSDEDGDGTGEDGSEDEDEGGSNKLTPTN